MIKELRDKTGAGMQDCQKALKEAAGDLEKAALILRKKGAAKAAKRSGRTAGEGIIKAAVADDGKAGYMLEFRAETDFAVKSERFQSFADELFRAVLKYQPASREDALRLEVNGQAATDAAAALSGVIGEKIDIGRWAILKSSGTIGAYVHANGKIAALLALENPGLADLAHDLAMQIAASNPAHIKPEDVPAEELDKEKEIWREQLAAEGKPAEIMEKIIMGKQKKYYEEICLLEQEYIKDDKKNVKDVVGGEKIESFIRFSLD